MCLTFKLRINSWLKALFSHFWGIKFRVQQGPSMQHVIVANQKEWPFILLFLFYADHVQNKYMTCYGNSSEIKRINIIYYRLKSL